MAAGLARSLGATAMQGVGAAGEIGGEVEGGGGGERDRAGGGVRPGGVAGPRPPLPRPTSELGSRIFVAISGSGPRPAQPDGEDEVEHPKGEDFGFGRWGVREGGERQGGGLGGRGDRIALPCASLQAGCEAVRVRQGQVEPRRRVGEPAGVEAGRPAGEVAPQPEQLRRRPELVADGEAQVAQRAFVGVEAQDLGGGRGALKRQAGAQRPGGGRVAAQERVEQREAGAGEEQRIALPCPSARPRPGRDRRRRRKGLPFRGFRRGPLRSRAPAEAARERPRRGRRRVGNEGRGRRESPGAW